MSTLFHPTPSKDSRTPFCPEVEVWMSSSRLVQVTFSPTTTLSPGKDSLTISTLVVPGAAWASGAGSRDWATAATMATTTAMVTRIRPITAFPLTRTTWRERGPRPTRPRPLSGARRTQTSWLRW